ncbi:MAG: efflux RND transporter permease subunit [Bdellovibrionales bacterium]|nr:efflux RND transporter permease subunit [Bdellovibrionales bacterium]
MINSLPSISIRNPVFAWMIMSSLIIFGAISFSRMGISQLPDVDFPIVTVNVTLAGAAPEVMESSVVDVLEGQLVSVEGVKSITSSSTTGSATITLEFDISRNLDLALQDVQAKLAAAQRKLPDDVDPPTASKTNPEDQPILWLGVTTTSMEKRDFMTYVRDNIKDQFSTITGVGDIFLGGYVDPNIRVWVQPDKLTKYSLTVSDILGTITAEHSEPPSGYVDTGARELNLRTLGEATTADDFRNLRINTRGGTPNYLPIKIGDATRIEPGLDDIRRISRVDGKSAVGLGIRKQRGANAVEAANGVLKKLDQIRKNLPPGIEIKPVFDSTIFIRQAVSELNFTLVLSAILTSLVILFFLGSFANTLNVLLAIPTSIVGTFMILYFSGFTLNTFTLLALSLAIGIVVDDAIMVLENITRHKEMGKTARQGALDGANEIMFAAMAATVSIIAIFLPVAFMKGIIGKFFYQFGVTMTGAVLLSLVEAITLTPMRAASFGGTKREEGRIARFVNRFMERFLAFYRRILTAALAHRWKVVIGAILFFVGSLGITKRLNKEFLPPEDQSRFMVRFLAPVGSSLDYTNQKVLEAEAILKEFPEIKTVFASAGGFGSAGVNGGMAFVTLVDRGERKRGQFEIMDAVRKRLATIKGVKSFTQDLSARGFSTGKGYPIEFSIQGGDWSKLADASEKIKDEMEKTGVLIDVDSDYQVGMPEVQIIPDRTRAANRGISVQAIGQTVNAVIGGVLAGYYTQNGRRSEIQVKLDEKDDRTYQQKIDSLYLRNNRGELVPMRDVVEVKEAKSLQQITRKDRQRAITIYSNVKSGANQSAALAMAEQIARKNLPEGYRFVTTGTSQTFQESFTSLIVALFLGIVVAYMVLGSQFNSFIDPVTVLLALPFSLSGAFFALWMSGKSLNLYSMIGLLLLMGIVKKNSILLVEFTNHVRDHGEKDVNKALLEACPNRLRPIVMTSLATVVGAIPAAVSIGPGAESREPMALAVIGGVIVSTILTLVVVPCFYSLFAAKRRTVLDDLDQGSAKVP